MFSSKYRGEDLVGEVAMVSEGIIRKTCSELDIEVIDMFVSSDHIHCMIYVFCASSIYVIMSMGLNTKRFF
ncbi:MAG: transposase [Methanosarcinaceae archaeon]